MTNFNKNFNKYTKTYLKKIEDRNFSEEETIIYKTICLMTVNSLIYFMAAIEESDFKYTGIHINKWKTEKKKITEKEIHELFEAITNEYFLEALDSSQALKFEQLEEWSTHFKERIERVEDEEEHLVDRAFKRLKLENVARNEVPVMTFVNIISSLYQRIDKKIEIIVYGE